MIANRRLLWAVVVLACVVSAGILLIVYGLHRLGEAKTLRVTSGVVKSKEHIRFDEHNHTYVSDFGETYTAEPGTEVWRVYYQIDNFNQVPEPKRSEPWKSEEERIRRFGFRFRSYTKDEKGRYDRAEIGDRLEVEYHYMGDQKEILSVRNLTHPGD